MIDLDKETIEIECPRCKFYNRTFLRQIKLRDVIICRGCKSNIRLDDYMNEYRKAEKSIRRTFEELESSLKGFNVTINF
jgi:transcription initiation factor IIE alpha subunit